MSEDYGYDFSRLTGAQQNILTFQGWYVGSKYPDGSTWPQPQKRTVKKLIERGLVVPRERRVPAFGGLTMTVIEYEVPLSVHMAWCMQC